LQSEIKRILILSDAHRPFHNKEAYNLVLSFAKDINLSEIIINGDYADFYNISSYGKSPLVSDKFNDEVDDVVSGLRELKKICSNVTFIEGNHEWRLARFISENCKEFHNYLSVEKIFFLKELGIKFVPFTPTQLYQIDNSDYYIRHQPLGMGQHCAYQTLLKAQASVIFGDCHRIQRYFTTSINGKEVEAIGTGWLGDKKSEVFNYVRHHHVWQLGFGLVTIRNDRAYCEAIHIKENNGVFSFIADGVLYTT